MRVFPWTENRNRNILRVFLANFEPLWVWERAGTEQTDSDGNRRKKAETHGITQTLIWRFTCRGFVAILSAKKSCFSKNSPQK